MFFSKPFSIVLSITSIFQFISRYGKITKIIEINIFSIFAESALEILAKCLICSITMSIDRDMGEMEQIRRCPVCGRAIAGRSDKKFCSDICRTFYHNKRRLSKRKEGGLLARLLSFFHRR